MKWHYWIRQGRKLITHLHTTRMHYTCASNISDNPGFVLPQELCLMTAKNFELLYSFQISLHCSAVIKKHFVRVFVCCRSALTHINKAACWTSSCPPGRRLQHGTWSWHNASKYTKINKIENRNDKKKKKGTLAPGTQCMCCVVQKWVQNRTATLGFYTAIYCFAFNPCTNFYLHSLGLFQMNLYLHKFYAHMTTFATTWCFSLPWCFFASILQAQYQNCCWYLSISNAFSGQSIVNKFFSHNNLCEERAACL